MLRFACRNLLSRPVRSALALLGLTVAIMGMVGLFSVAAGLQATVDKTFNRVPGIVAMQPGAPIPIFSKVPVEWADEIAAMPGVRVVCREYWSRAQLIEGRVSISPPRLLFGADVERINRLKTGVYRDDIVEGRYLEAEDQDEPRCVISRHIAEEHHKKLGDTLRVDGYALTIVGIYQTDSLWIDLAIIVPNGTARVIARHDPKWLSAMYIEPDGTVPTEALIETIRDRFRGRGTPADMSDPLGLAAGQPGNPLLTNLAKSFLGNQPATTEEPKDGAKEPADDQGLKVQSAQSMGKEVLEFSADLDIFLVLMNSIGVVVALLSILNTMLMSVSERLTEFGVLRANGWTAGNILNLILAESAILGVCGGTLGCLLGWAGTLALNARFPSKLDLYASPTVLVCSLVFSTALGMLGGLYPAIWSVRRSPMEAIRRG
jgi:putative ABC transport system permease protein